MANIRPLKVNDYPRIAEILEQHDFELPDGRAIVQAVIEEDDKIIAYGVTRVLAENVMILDKNCSDRQKYEAIKLLHERAIFGCESLGIRHLHAFVEDPHFVEILKKHYGYSDCVGKAIVLVSGG